MADYDSQEVVESELDLQIIQLKKDYRSLKDLEEVYTKLVELKEKNRLLRESILFKGKVMSKIYWTSLVIILVVFVLVSTLDSSDVWTMLEEHIDTLGILTEAFAFDFDEEFQFFFNTIVVSFFDALVCMCVITFVPALVKLVIIGINRIRIKRQEKIGIEEINNRRQVIGRYPVRIVSSLAISHIIQCFMDGSYDTIDGAVASFDEFIRTTEGKWEISQIALELQEMREGLKAAGLWKSRDYE